MKKILLTAVILVAVLTGGFLLRYKKDVVVNTPTPVVSPMPTPLVSPELITPEINSDPKPANLIIYTDSGYTPSTITIKKGETVTWKNQSSGGMWTASAVHPTHRAYPGTNIAFCGAPPPDTIQFDACRGIASGQSWSFKFYNAGTWGYHNHVNARDTGKVIVE